MTDTWQAHFSRQGAVISEKSNQITKTLKKDNSGLSLTTIADFGLVEVSGVDSAKFLQGQVTCDVNKDSAQWQLGAACTPKGRMYTSFFFTRSEDHILLRMHSSTVQTSLETLKKYAAFFKTTLNDVSTDYIGIAVWGANCLAILTETLKLKSPPEEGHTVMLADGNWLLCHRYSRAELWLKKHTLSSSDWLEQLIEQSQIEESEAWNLKAIEAGEAFVTSPTQDHFIPQMLNYNHLGGISFTKGCYTGQEIVARMKYLGKLKKQTFLGTTQSHHELSPGMTLQFADQGGTAGEIISASKTGGNGWKLLAVVNIADVEAGKAITTASGDSLIQWLPLPYTTSED